MSLLGQVSGRTRPMCLANTFATMSSRSRRQRKNQRYQLGRPMSLLATNMCFAAVHARGTALLRPDRGNERSQDRARLLDLIAAGQRKKSWH